MFSNDSAPIEKVVRTFNLDRSTGRAPAERYPKTSNSTRIPKSQVLAFAS
jgi:hypothetical protein